MAVLYGPMTLHLDAWSATGAFMDGHVWAFDHIHRMLSGEVPWSKQTDRLGFPNWPILQFIAWAPAVLAHAFRLVLGPLGAFNLTFLLSPGIAAAVAALLVLRLTPAPPAVAALVAPIYGLSTYTLGCVAIGQVCKAQHWVLPSVLLCAHVATRGSWRARLGGLVATWAVGVAGAFSEPTYAMMAPVVLAVPLLLDLFRALVGPERRMNEVGLVLGSWTLLLVPLAGLLALASTYYEPTHAFHAFAPATRAHGLEEMELGVASVAGLVLPPRSLPDDPFATMALYSLGWVSLGVAAFGLSRGRAHAVGYGLLAVGVVFALGEYLFWDDEPVRVAGNVLRMPAAALFELDYPLSRSGLYYRFVAVAQLGLVLLAARVLAQASWLWAALVLVLAMAENIGGTLSLWPRSGERVAGIGLMAEFAADTSPGAVLDLPIGSSFAANQRYLLLASLHNRPTSALPQAVDVVHTPMTRHTSEEVTRALTAWDAASAIAALGIRYVTWHPYPWAGGPTRAEVEAKLGEPRVTEGIAWWKLEHVRTPDLAPPGAGRPPPPELRPTRPGP